MKGQMKNILHLNVLSVWKQLKNQWLLNAVIYFVGNVYMKLILNNFSG